MKRFLIAFLVVILSGFAGAEDFLVPLDDRPANRLFVEQLARIGRPQEGLTTVPRHLLGKLYDPGQSDAIIAWIEEHVEPGDTVFLSADMWLYGGLVASRTAAIDLETVEQRLAILEQLGKRGIDLHVLATIPRLSLRTSNEQAPYETKLSQWATGKDLPSAAELVERYRAAEAADTAEADSETTEANPGAVDAAAEATRAGPSDAAADLPFPEGIPADIVIEYLEVRNRNVNTIGRLIELSNQGVLSSLVLGQDDSNKTGIHHYEHEQIRGLISELKVADKVTLLSGIDELTLNMVSGVWADRANLSPKVKVVYSDPEAANKIPPLESLPLNTMVRQHLELAGARLVTEEPHDLYLMIYVPQEQPWQVPGEERRPASEAFVNDVLKAMERGERVAVADLSLVNRMDPFLAESSLEKLSLFELEGFASWNTPANTTGTVISQAVNRYIAKNSPQWSLPDRLESEKTHQAFLLARYIDDYVYQTVVRDEIRKDNKDPAINADPLLNQLGPAGIEIRLRLIEWTNDLFEKRYLGQSFCLEPQGIQVEFYRSKLEVVLPWHRTFEVEARLDLRIKPNGEKCSGER